MGMISPPGAPGEDRSLEPRGRRLDLLADSEATGRWLEEHGLPCQAEIHDRDVEQMRELRTAIREVFAARIDGVAPSATPLAIINQVAAAAPPSPQLAWTEDGPRREWQSPRASGVQAAGAEIAADAIAVAATELGDTLRACEAHGCIRLFLQNHGRRRWCSTTCGDRVRVARHYMRTHQPAGTRPADRA
ncbi:MAG: CGNR zinc finger domain-containing protein [Rubrobacteraceae bacterium]|nr:CGNR zinc finger domain-containing protein [Rubrobacteraceae bacterium]